MYELVLILHSCLRLALVALAVMAFVRALHGLFAGRMYTRGDRTVGLVLVIVADVQMLVGLALYFVLSPAAASARANFGAAMKDPELRRTAVEHPTMMIGALVLLHVGNALKKRVETDALRHRWIAITVGVALLLLVIGSSWPWNESHARPFLRFSGAG